MKFLKIIILSLLLGNGINCRAQEDTVRILWVYSFEPMLGNPDTLTNVGATFLFEHLEFLCSDLLQGKLIMSFRGRSFIDKKRRRNDGAPNVRKLIEATDADYAVVSDYYKENDSYKIHSRIKDWKDSTISSHSGNLEFYYHKEEFKFKPSSLIPLATWLTKDIYQIFKMDFKAETITLSINIKHDSSTYAAFQSSFLENNFNEFEEYNQQIKIVEEQALADLNLILKIDSFPASDVFNIIYVNLEKQDISVYEKYFQIRNKDFKDWNDTSIQINEKILFILLKLMARKL